ncbi:MAG: hypothetical protein H6621_04740 [Halobacteriovoraceae bacterium]|nr:hypothetical protein [Halobacteriovoraceae bacterium]
MKLAMVLLLFSFHQAYAQKNLFWDNLFPILVTTEDLENWKDLTGQWNQIRDVSQEIVFQTAQGRYCLKLNRKKIIFYHTIKDLRCAGKKINEVDTSFENLYRLFLEEDVYYFEVANNKLTEMRRFPLINVKLRDEWRQWDHSGSQLTIEGLKIISIK